MNFGLTRRPDTERDYKVHDQPPVKAEGVMETHHNRDSDPSKTEPKHDAEDIEDEYRFPLDFWPCEHKQAYGNGDKEGGEDSLDN